MKISHFLTLKKQPLVTQLRALIDAVWSTGTECVPRESDILQVRSNRENKHSWPLSQHLPAVTSWQPTDSR
jgi:hypothetical protein